MLAQGIDPATADMVYINGKYSDFNFDPPKIAPLVQFSAPDTVLADNSNLPAWSLAALLDVLPTEIRHNNAQYRLVMRKWYDSEDDIDAYEFAYESLLEEGNLVFVSNASTPLTAAWRLLYALLKKRIILPIEK